MRKIILLLVIASCTPKEKESEPSLKQVTTIQSLITDPTLVDKLPFRIQGRTYITPVYTLSNGVKVITLDLKEAALPVSTQQLAALKLKADVVSLATKADVASVKLKADITYVNSVAGRITALETRIKQIPTPAPQKNYDSIITALNKQIEVLKSDNHTIQDRQIVLDTTIKNLPTIYTTGTYGLSAENPLKP